MNVTLQAPGNALTLSTKQCCELRDRSQLSGEAALLQAAQSRDRDMGIVPSLRGLRQLQGQ